MPSSRPTVVQAWKRGPQGDVVAMLRHMLHLAEAGHIRAVAVAVHSDIADTGTGFALGDGDIAHLVLALERTKLRLLNESNA